MLSRHDAKISNLPYYMGDCLPSSTEIPAELTAELSIAGRQRKTHKASNKPTSHLIDAEPAHLHLLPEFRTDRLHFYPSLEHPGKLT